LDLLWLKDSSESFDKILRGAAAGGSAMGSGEQAAGGGARKNDDRIRGSTIGVTISHF